MSTDPDPEIVDNIKAKLLQAERDHSVRILFAIESGSRAWGFPSPDSDYDVRFVYAHETDWYLSLAPGRDVIELPLDETYDINGWDIRKALNLSLRSNPVMLEWLTSPMVYRRTPLMENLQDFFLEAARPNTFLHHYSSFWHGMWTGYIADKSDVKIKKYLNAIRPIFALDYLRQYPEALPPMNVQAVMAKIDMPKPARTAIEALILQKRDLKEADLTRRNTAIDEWVNMVSAWANDVKHKPAPNPNKTKRAEALFREIVKGKL